jgi:hypothetical protein
MRSMPSAMMPPSTTHCHCLHINSRISIAVFLYAKKRRIQINGLSNKFEEFAVRSKGAF